MPPTLGGTTFNPVQPTPEFMAMLNQGELLEDCAAADFKAGRYSQAEGKAREALAVGVANAGADQTLAEALFEQGKDAEALKAYKRIPITNQPELLLPYAMLLLRSGDWAQAVTAYNKALPTMYFGNFLVAGSNFTPALRQKTKLETDIHIAFGLCLLDRIGIVPNSEPTRKEFQEAIDLSPDCAEAYYELGKAYDWRVCTGEAQAVFTKAIQLGTGDLRNAALDAYERTLHINSIHNTGATGN